MDTTIHCAKMVVDSTGKITNVISEISCNPQIQYVNDLWSNPWFWGIGGIALFAIFLFVWFVWLYPRWNVWASAKSGEADLMQAHKEQQIQVAKAQGRLDAATVNKQAAIVEAEAVSKQIETIGANLKEHDLYLKWQWIKMMEEKPDASVIYVPTEAGMPILEAGKRSNS